MIEKIKNFNSIDIVKLLCSIMVIAIHTHVFMDINATLGYVVVNIVSAVAVPFFFITSGYFYTKGLQEGKKNLFKYVKKLLRIYICWSIIYYVMELIYRRANWNITYLLDFTKKSIIMFFTTGISEHLWFFPALFFSTVVATIFYKFNGLRFLGFVSLILYIVGLLGCSYYGLGITIPILNVLIENNHFTLIRRVLLMGLPFFMAGYFINNLQSVFRNMKKISLIIIILTVTFLYIMEIIFVNAIGLQKSIVITGFLYPLVCLIFITCLRNPMIELNAHAYTCRGVSNLVYLVHPLIMRAWSIIFLYTMGIKLDYTPYFILVCLSSLICGYIALKINNRFIN